MKKSNLVPAVSKESNLSELSEEREGYFKEGYDKLGRPYEKKLDIKGVYTKKEILKDGTQKLTIKKKP